MTLSLDDVRNKRFRLARKSGYEVAEVDDFLDQLQESFAQLIEENENLKKQIDALGQEPADASHSDASPADEAVAPAVAAPAPREAAEPETVVVTTSSEASVAVVRLVQLSTEHAEQLVAEAAAEAERIRAEADEAAQKLSAETETEAERLAAEARERAESVRADAQSRAAQLDAETTERRQQLFGALDQERSTLAGAIEELRQFEQTFRSNLTDQLRRHIDILESGHAEPGDVPDLAASSASIAAETTGRDAAADDTEAEDQAADPSTQDDGSTDEAFETDPDATVQVSDTPRLDALLGDQR